MTFTYAFWRLDMPFYKSLTFGSLRTATVFFARWSLG